MKKKNVIFIVIIAIIISLGLGCFVGIEYSKKEKIKKAQTTKL